MRGLRCAALIAALTLPCLAQSGATPKLVLDEAKPIVYIELDHIGPRPPVEGDEPGRGIWLRLVNNSVVPIEVQPMGTGTDPELTLLPDEIVGRWTRIEESDAPEPKRPHISWRARHHFPNKKIIAKAGCDIAALPKCGVTYICANPERRCAQAGSHKNCKEQSAQISNLSTSNFDAKFVP